MAEGSGELVPDLSTWCKNIMMEAEMNRTSFLAKKRIEYLLESDHNQGNETSLIFSQLKSKNIPAFHVLFLRPGILPQTFLKKICNGCGACFGPYPVGAIAFNDDKHLSISN